MYATANGCFEHFRRSAFAWWRNDRAAVFGSGRPTSPFKSTLRLEAENVALRHQLVILLRARRLLLARSRWGWEITSPRAQTLSKASERSREGSEIGTKRAFEVAEVRAIRAGRRGRLSGAARR